MRLNPFKNFFLGRIYFDDLDARRILFAQIQIPVADPLVIFQGPGFNAVFFITGAA